MGTWSYALADGLGSVRQQTDSEGYVVQQVDYSPFGKVVAVAGVPLTGRGYTGERWDGNVGLLYLRARWYDPATGRFLTPTHAPRTRNHTSPTRAHVLSGRQARCAPTGNRAMAQDDDNQ